MNQLGNKIRRAPVESEDGQNINATNQLTQQKRKESKQRDGGGGDGRKKKRKREE